LSGEEVYPEGTDELFLSIKKAAKKLLNMGNRDVIFVFTHIDADGLSSGAILAYTLFKLQKPFVLVPINQIHSKTIEYIEKTYAPEEAIFLDLGSGYIGQILDSLNHLRELIILDHHIPGALKTEPSIKVYHINPWLYNIDGGKYISSSGLAYLLAISYKQRFPEIIKLSRLAITGALGDSQDIGVQRDLLGINKLILNQAIHDNIIDAKIDLLFFGKEQKPLYRTLSEFYTLILPGITGSDDGAKKFLLDIGILDENRDPDTFYFRDLNSEEKNLLVEKLLERAIFNYSDISNIDVLRDSLVGFVYYFKEDNIKITNDAREFATILNACGKSGFPEMGIRFALTRSEELTRQIVKIVNDYKNEISRIISKALKEISIKGNLCVINGQKFISEGLSSTIASIISRIIKREESILIIISKANYDMLKISARKCNNSNINLRDLLVKAVENIQNASAGGHINAAGAYIPKESLEIFLENLMRLIKH